MGKTKQSWHRGTHQVRAKRLTNQAYANPDTRCWRCGLTLGEIHRRYPKATWTAGHLRAGEIGGPLLPECSHCNYSHGAAMGNRTRNPKPTRTNLTW